MLQLPIFVLGFSCQGQAFFFFLNLLLRFLMATQEMGFNVFAGLSVWGLFNEDPVAVQQGWESA